MSHRSIRIVSWVGFGLILAAVTARAAGQEERIGPLALNEAATLFSELERACAERDGGRLWGVEACGPVLLVDHATRRVVTNQADEEGLLEERAGVFVGQLPRDQPIANAPLDWGGVRWAMVVAGFLPDDPASRVTLLAHESFHRIQPQLDLYPMAGEAAHLAEADGRYWLKLEWNALEAAALEAGAERRTAIADALAFRAARRALRPDAAALEGAVEIREGIAQYTGLRIAGRLEAEMVEHGRGLRIRIDRGLPRSFGYVSGPLYGYLLEEATRGSWRRQLAKDSDLGALLASALDLEPDAGRAPGRAAHYGGQELRAAEDQRERERQELLALWRDDLVEGPVLIVDLALCSSKTMDTRHVHPFDEGRTVFTVRGLIAEWGRLEVGGQGAILEDSETQLGRVSLKDAAEDRRSGRGWTLQLNAGWIVTPGDRAGDFVVRRGGS